MRMKKPGAVSMIGIRKIVISTEVQEIEML